MKAKDLYKTGLLFLVAALTVLIIPCTSAALPYERLDLVSDIPGTAAFTDPDLVNAWGISVNPANGVIWVSDAGTGKSTLYDGAGVKQSLVVTIPPAGSGTPTGQVFNPSSDFGISAGGVSGPSRFIFASEDGTISGWNPSVNATNAIVAVDNSASGAVYKGLSIGRVGTDSFLYAANFSGGTVDMFDENFSSAGSFTDPNIPAGFAPFNVENLGGQLFVTYAMLDAATGDDIPGPGNGFVDVFDLNGTLVRRLASDAELNSPWGLAVAPGNFGQFSNDVLVGNFGDGRISAYDPASGDFLGQLQDSRGVPLEIDGLWALKYTEGAPNTSPFIYFSAGPDDESHGLFGIIQPVPEPATMLLLGAGLLGGGFWQKRTRRRLSR